ncbi:hypothetical protein ASPCAL09456 [Aspergillus calidoustus]|uniref:Luciferase domain-containing protein n=1 Tax=Aspergillus calidoustus TaxID=454130 RepID=A0A0U5GVV0_ASPCI|nr:hypothetical protein ASPCAL09456 [Aspergillus calidoustus]
MASSNLKFVLSYPDHGDFPFALLSVFRVQLVLLFLLPLAVYLTHTIRKDYHAFLALGPGGTPSTPAGYLRICILRLVSLRNPLEPPLVPPTLNPKHGFLSRAILPLRSGPRPTVVGIAPQRQITQKSGPPMYDALSAEIRRLTNSHPNTLFTATSCFEKHSTGIFYRFPTSTACPNPGTTRAGEQQQHNRRPQLQSHKHRITCNGEVCHSHPSDGSLHLTLHPADVELVIERGWGQRHPLARDDWWWVTRFVPAGFVMIYAPRDADELKCVVEIIRAAAWWVGGKELR